MNVTSVGLSGVSVKGFPVNALAGRGRTRATWVEYVHSILLMEFERYVAACVQLSRNILVDIALRIINEPGSPYGPADIVEWPCFLFGDL